MRRLMLVFTFFLIIISLICISVAYEVDSSLDYFEIGENPHDIRIDHLAQNNRPVSSAVPPNSQPVASTHSTSSAKDQSSESVWLESVGEPIYAHNRKTNSDHQASLHSFTQGNKVEHLSPQQLSSCISLWEKFPSGLPDSSSSSNPFLSRLSTPLVFVTLLSIAFTLGFLTASHFKIHVTDTSSSPSVVLASASNSSSGAAAFGDSEQTSKHRFIRWSVRSVAFVVFASFVFEYLNAMSKSLSQYQSALAHPPANCKPLPSILPTWFVSLLERFSPFKAPFPDGLDMSDDASSALASSPLSQAVKVASIPFTAVSDFFFKSNSENDCALYHRRTNSLFVILHNPLEVLIRGIASSLLSPLSVLIDIIGDALRLFLDKFNAVEKSMVLFMLCLVLLAVILVVVVIAIKAPAAVSTPSTSSVLSSTSLQTDSQARESNQHSCRIEQLMQDNIRLQSQLIQLQTTLLLTASPSALTTSAHPMLALSTHLLPTSSSTPLLPAPSPSASSSYLSSASSSTSSMCGLSISETNSVSAAACTVISNSGPVGNPSDERKADDDDEEKA